MTQFSIGSNRTRPPYTIKTLRCPSCSSPLQMYSERSQLIVCDFCGERLDCSEEDLIALGKVEKSAKPPFSLNLHSEYYWEDVKYKVIARMRFLDQYRDRSDEYLLFHPFHGTRWLSFYYGEDGVERSISMPKRVLARSISNQFRQPQYLTTEDGERWILDESGSVRLEYVDGALPWKAVIGDTHQVAEYINQKDRNQYLSVEWNRSQVEYTYSQKIPKSRSSREPVSFSDVDEVTKTKLALALLLIVMAFNYFTWKNLNKEDSNAYLQNQAIRGVYRSSGGYGSSGRSFSGGGLSGGK